LQLARALGVSKVSLWRWESGLAEPTERSRAKFDALQRLSRQELVLRCQPYRKGKLRAQRQEAAESFGTRLHRLRTEKRLSMVEVARALGITRQALWKWETDETRPSGDYLSGLAEVLHVPVAELATGSGVVASEGEKLPSAQIKAVNDLIAKSKAAIAKAAGTSPDNVTITVTREPQRGPEMDLDGLSLSRGGSQPPPHHCPGARIQPQHWPGEQDLPARPS
jgi:transcriptional regulator with XRE-family HTH domain